jgi:hypothetical protein
LVGLSWIVLNWLLSVASIFPLAEHQPAFDAIGSVLRLLQRRTGPTVVTGMLFGVMHVGLIIVCTGVGISMLMAARALGAGPVIFLEVLLVAAYSIVADSLCVSCLAAYVSLLRPEEVGTLEVTRVDPGPDRGSRVDPDELILSDVPLPAI